MDTMGSLFCYICMDAWNLFFLAELCIKMSKDMMFMIPKIHVCVYLYYWKEDIMAQLYFNAERVSKTQLFLFLYVPCPSPRA